jgi:hypothetical protein
LLIFSPLKTGEFHPEIFRGLKFSARKYKKAFLHSN